jgi:drug/metabolite transporter (DMT)-like permease
MSAVRQTMRGIAAMVASQFALSVNDTFVKLASETLPLGEVIFVRGVFASLLVGTVVVTMGQLRYLLLLRHRLVFWRIFGELGATYFFLLALFKMPLANVAIIFQATPLAVTAAAALFLGESVGWRRWTAIAIGFVGVAIVVRPGLGGFQLYALLVLVSVLFVVVRDLSTRALPLAVPAMVLTLATAVSVTIMGALLGLDERWSSPSWTVLAQLLAAAAFLSVGYLMIIAAMRLGEMSAIVPFRYSNVVFAIVLGVLVWGDIPDAVTIVGSVIIIATGLYTLYRERKVAAAPPHAAQSGPIPPA